MNSNSPAYPTSPKFMNGSIDNKGVDGGLTKREYFAIMALQGLLSDEQTMLGASKNRHSLANAAVTWADELIQELSK